MLKRWLISLSYALFLLLLPILSRTTFAHAVIAGSDPPANSVLAESPSEIRLWFTEPLEPMFSNFDLRDATGAIVLTKPGSVDPANPTVMTMQPGELPDGLYTVVWRNVSAADGHRVVGSYPFSIGAGNATMSAAAPTQIELSPYDMLARWANFVGLALAVGGIAFIVLVWQPTMRDTEPTALHPLWGMAWIGWWLAGIGGALILLNQSAIVHNVPFREAFDLDRVGDVVKATRFGTYWMARLVVWVAMGVLLWVARRSARFAWLATGLGLLMLLSTSLLSHAAANSDRSLSIFTDWVHLVMASLWVGGLAQFLVAIPVIALLIRPAAPKLGTMVVYFSNFARVAVVGLIITGIFATWSQVNTLEIFLTTYYGRLLGIKLILTVLLLMVAAINFLWTQRRLLAGEAIWVGRLRKLVSVELLLAFGVLLVVGAMTALSPARTEAAQAVAPPAVTPTPAPLQVDAEVDDLKVQLVASPGWVGMNSFTIKLLNLEDDPIPNVKLMRLRFEHQTEKLGESELQIRPEAESPEGVYAIDGANLSTVGDWRLRMTIQRPEAFDSVVDLPLTVIAAPPPPLPPVIESNPSLPYRSLVLLDVGVVALVAGLYFFLQQRFRLWPGAWLLPSILVVLGATFLATYWLT